MLYSVAQHHVGKRFRPDSEQVMDMLVSITPSHRQSYGKALHNTYFIF